MIKKTIFKKILQILIKFHENFPIFQSKKEIPENFMFSVFFQEIDTLSLSRALQEKKNERKRSIE